MWLVFFLCFSRRFGFGFHCFQPFFTINDAFSGYITIEKYSFNVCVLHVIWIKKIPSLLLPANPLSPKMNYYLPQKKVHHCCIIHCINIIIQLCINFYVVHISFHFCSQLFNHNAPWLGSPRLCIHK
jgi:hypothetical protein